MQSAGPTTGWRKFDSETKEASDASGSITNSTSTSNVGATNDCINILGYFRSSTNKEADKTR